MNKLGFVNSELAAINSWLRRFGHLGDTAARLAPRKVALLDLRAQVLAQVSA